jgi:hypothetical protein
MSPAAGAEMARASRSWSPTRPESTRPESTRPESTRPESTRPGANDLTGPLSDPEFVAGLRAVPSGLGGSAPPWPAVDIVGVRPDGTPVTVDLAARSRPVLLVFLSIGCDGCDVFWAGLADPPAAIDVVAVTKGASAVSPDEVAALATCPVVMSGAAWLDYRVTGYPFLVLLDPVARRILAESVGFEWSDIDAMLTAAEPGDG